MNVFPVSKSNLSPHHLGAFVGQYYFSGQPVECRILKTGISDTYLIEMPHGRYIFRVYSFQWRTQAEILEELRLLEYLHQNGISVSYPIPDLEGTLIHALQAPEGERYGVLFSYADGKKRIHLDPEMHFQAGAMMARMHLLTRDLALQRVDYSEQNLVLDSLVHLSRFLPGERDEMHYMQRVQAYLVQEWQQADPAQLRRGAVHLDLWFDNMNVTDDGAITFFDFDFCGNGWLCLDLAYYVMQIHSTEKDEAECLQKKAAFYSGYESICEISKEEKRLIPMLGISLYFFYLGIQSQRYDDWSNAFLNEIYLQRFINLLLKKYLDYHQLGPGTDASS